MAQELPLRAENHDAHPRCPTALDSDACETTPLEAEALAAHAEEGGATRCGTLRAIEVDRPGRTAAWYSVRDGLCQGFLDEVLDVALPAPIAGRLARVGLLPKLHEIRDILLQLRRYRSHLMNSNYNEFH